ncbi:hypothetical protein [Caudoviricetes sp.]|nr:hypothetical protein [Caudoviricetes sp.]
MNMFVQEKVKEASLSAIVTRADGTIEDLGTIAYYHKNPLKVLSFNIGKFFHKLVMSY